MELSCKVDIDARKEDIWPFYADPAKRAIWENDLESLSFDGKIETGGTGKMKLANMPEMPFTLTKVEPYVSYWDRTDVPGMGSLDFGHDIVTEGERVTIEHTVRFEKDGFSDEDLDFLRGVFADVPDAVMKIKREASR